MLRRNGPATADQLGQSLTLTTNAIRRHLAILEEDGLIQGVSSRRGPTKPAIEYALTEACEAFFPSRYDRLLEAVLDAVRERSGELEVGEIFADVARRAGDRHRDALSTGTQAERLATLAGLLRDRGVEAEIAEDTHGGLALVEHTCPYAKSVETHPEICGIVHGLVAIAAPHGFEQSSSIARGDDACRFEIRTAPSVQPAPDFTPSYE